MARQVTSYRGLRGENGEREKGVSILLAAFILITALSSPGCSGKDDKIKEVKVSNVKVMVVEKKQVRPYIDAIGTLNPNDKVTISSEVDGILDGINVNEGTEVFRGMVLCLINPTNYRLGVANARAALKQAEANFANLKIEYKRKESLFREELVTTQQFDDITTRLTIAAEELDRAKVALSLASEKLMKATIRSPIKGIVEEKKVTAGDFIRASQPVLSIVQINPLKLSFTVTERDVSLLKTGQEIVFTVDSFPGREFSGNICTIYPSLDQRTRTLKVEAVVPNNSLELKPGFFAKVKVFTSAAHEAILIPATSILYDGTKIRSFIQEGNKARERPLKIGKKYGEMVEVLQGLNGGEKLISVGQNSLTDGAGIKVVR